MAMTSWEVTLVSAAKAGDSMAFEELYERYHKKVFALARTTLRNDADAEDILQQAFISAWRHLDRLSDPAAFNTWIQRITLNLCYSLMRKKNLAIILDAESDIGDFEDEESDELLPAVYAERDDLRERLGKIIDSLSEVQKQTIVLYYFNELKVEEIAQVMECNSGTVKTRLSLARKSIRSEIELQESMSGQKFYGIAGIAMLGLGRLIAQQIEIHALSPAVSSGIMQAITQSITQGAIAGAQTAASAAGSAANYAPSATGSAASYAPSAAGSAGGCAAPAAPPAPSAYGSQPMYGQPQPVAGQYAQQTGQMQPMTSQYAPGQQYAQQHAGSRGTVLLLLKPPPHLIR